MVICPRKMVISWDFMVMIMVILWDFNGTLWLLNIAMEAMAHLQMVYLLKMVIFHGYVNSSI
jgi:hypothetical protein